jgi:putative metallohydrolase (TIGR04338 family)
VADPARGAADRDRSKVYEAEALVRRLIDRSAEFPTIEVAGSRITLPVERRFGSVSSVQAYLDAVLAHPQVLGGWPDRAAVPVTVRRRRGLGQAHYEFATATIAVPTAMSDAGGTAWAMRELVVLHELAHHLTGAPTGSRAAHGREFRSVLLDLVELLVGPELRLLLLVSYSDGGIRPV